VIQELIVRELRARRDFITGTVSSELEFRKFDATAVGGPVVTCRVNIGGNRILENVPVKSVNGDRAYARLGQVVLLKKNAQGRYEVVGPSDRKTNQENVVSYDLNTQLSTGSQTTGFIFERVPFEFYMGPQSMKDRPNVTFMQVGGGNDTIVRDAGSFIDDGFLASQSVKVVGSPSNDGALTVAAVSATTLEFAGDVLTTEGPIANVRIGVVGSSLWGDGVTPFGLTRVLDGSGNPV